MWLFKFATVDWSVTLGSICYANQKRNALVSENFPSETPQTTLASVLSLFQQRDKQSHRKLILRVPILTQSQTYPRTKQPSLSGLVMRTKRKKKRKKSQRFPASISLDRRQQNTDLIRLRLRSIRRRRSGTIFEVHSRKSSNILLREI